MNPYPNKQINRVALALSATAITLALIGAESVFARDVQIEEALKANISASADQKITWLKNWPLEINLTQTAPPGVPGPPRDQHDLTGTWRAVLTRPAMHPDVGARADSFAPYKPDAEKIFNYRIKMNSDGKPVADSGIYCRPDGVTRGLTAPPYPFQIFTTPGKIWQLFGDRGTRVIYLDQAHPKSLKPSYMGHSVGHWEGNTLMVDTIGIKDGTWIDRAGSPGSEKMHITERISKSEDSLSFSDEMTIEDPVYYTQPFVIKTQYQWHPEIRPWNGFCEEEFHTVVVHGLQGVR